jgi:hypothetical protein
VAFRQQIGPGASAKQVQQLQTLLREAGYADFRSARGPLGLTQRQGLGKFTHDEATAIIERLERESEGSESVVDVSRSAPSNVARRPLKDTPTETLVAELRHRGWTASEG